MISCQASPVALLGRRVRVRPGRTCPRPQRPVRAGRGLGSRRLLLKESPGTRLPNCPLQTTGGPRTPGSAPPGHLGAPQPRASRLPPAPPTCTSHLLGTTLPQSPSPTAHLSARHHLCPKLSQQLPDPSCSTLPSTQQVHSIQSDLPLAAKAKIRMTAHGPASCCLPSLPSVHSGPHCFLRREHCPRGCPRPRPTAVPGPAARSGATWATGLRVARPGPTPHG